MSERESRGLVCVCEWERESRGLVCVCEWERERESRGLVSVIKCLVSLIDHIQLILLPWQMVVELWPLHPHKSLTDDCSNLISLVQFQYSIVHFNSIPVLHSILCTSLHFLYSIPLFIFIPVQPILLSYARTKKKQLCPRRSESEWMNEWMNEWRSEWMKEWMKEWVNEWMKEWVNEWMRRSEWLLALFDSVSITHCVIVLLFIVIVVQIANKYNNLNV